MRSPLRTLADTLVNRAPVPYVARDGVAPQGWLFGGGSDRTTELKATSVNGTVYSIVNRIANSTSLVDWHMHRQNQPQESVCPVCEQPAVSLVTDHWALRVWNRPNDFFTRQELVEAGQQHQDLTGETWLLVERDARVAFPMGLWTVRPDRMETVPSRENYLAGYIYKGPNGERIPLELDEVIQLRVPDPDDTYRGLGPIRAAMVDIDSARYSAQWNKNFFLNSAEPGGVIEFEDPLSDQQWKQFIARWDEQHRGVSRAHRVAVLEGGKWVNRTFSMRDMQFAEIRRLSRDFIREAFGINKFATGDIDDVNRATADTSKAWYAEQITVPRLERWRLALNNDFLPMFGSTGQGVEFVYNNPVPKDREAENAERDSKTSAWAALVHAGADPSDASQIVGLPPIRLRPSPAPQEAAA